MNKKMTADIQRGDTAPLIDSLREIIQLKIEEVNRAADHEIEVIDGELFSEIEEFRESQRTMHEEIIKYEGAKIRNLASTGMKKQKLEGIELFIGRIIDDAAGLIRNNPRYFDFLNSCVISALDNVKGGSATLLVSQADLSYAGDVTDKIRAGGYTFKINISADDRVKTGGAMVIDDDAEVIYNNSVERIVYRKKEQIRREIVRSLKEPGVNQDG
ncbi:MAG TPA: V-type ATP synthase subunit E [Spirochaetota bacterium]|nr:V-type ATP synthase subunit E [Spirochaetota bacterium]